MSITFTLNGEKQPLQPELTIAGLVSAYGLDIRKIAIEQNLAIVPRSLYSTTSIAANDQIEIVEFIGGG